MKIRVGKQINNMYRMYGCQTKSVLEKKTWITKVIDNIAIFNRKNTDRMPRTFPRKYSMLEKERAKTTWMESCFLSRLKNSVAIKATMIPWKILNNLRLFKGSEPERELRK
jgi:nitrate reductase beta subunit